MPIEKKIYEPDLQTDRAKNVKGERIYIGNAESGRKGYFCLGCDKPMQANIQRKNPNHLSYFSHVPVDLSKGEKKCTYSNREQRELIATDILQRIKTMKVPEVLKFPPKGVKGNPVELEKSRFITAHTVKSQLTFYEDEEGNIHPGKNPDVEERYLLLRPDVTFFNEKGKAILFIELVVTHKVSDEKKIKLRRMGIDTVSVVIPKGSDQEIEENFKSVKRVKWEYNGEEARTSYLSVSHRAPKGVLEFDEQQRRIFGESVPCRRSRINNTIRTLRKCLEGKSYRDTERDFEREIFRVKGATEGARERLERIQAGIDKEVRNQFEEQTLDLERQGGKLDEEETKFERNFEDLERRYKSKGEKIREEQERIISDKRRELEDGGTEEEIKERFRKGSEDLRREFDQISEEFRENISAKEESIEEISRRREELRNSFTEQEREIENRLVEQFRTKEKSLSGDIEREERNIHTIRERKSTISEEFRKLEEKERTFFKEQEREIGERAEKIIRRIREQEGAISEDFRKLEERERERYSEQEKEIAEQEENLERAILEELSRELEKSSDGLPREVGFILQAQRVGRDYEDAEREEARYKRAREFFEKGDWKTR